MEVRGPVLKRLKHFLGTFLVAPDQMGAVTLGYLRVSLVTAVVAKLNAATTAETSNRRQDTDVISKAVLLGVLDTVVQSFLGR